MTSTSSDSATGSRITDITDPEAVRRAVAEFDTVGQDAFLQKYGFGRAHTYALEVDGKWYDPKPILAAAYGYQFPDHGPLGNTFSGGESTTNPVLKRLGFEVVNRDSEKSPPTPIPAEHLLNLWCVYITKAGSNNFQLALKTGVWGAEERRRFDGVLKGDRLLIVEAITPDDDATKRQGFPRVPHAGFRGVAKSLRHGTVISDIYEDESELWSDKPYPFRFRFDADEPEMDVRFDDSSLSPQIVEATRLSALSGGRPIRVEAALPPTCSVWLFQAMPDRFNLVEELKAHRIGDLDDWYAPTNHSELGVGDIALLWQGGSEAGIYAVGEVTGPVFQRPIAEWHAKDMGDAHALPQIEADTP